MDDAIRNLLDVLEAAEDAGLSLTDTDIRELLYNVVDRGFMHEEPGYQVPANLFDHCGDAVEAQENVREALATFLQLARKEAAAQGWKTFEERNAAFMASDVTSSSGTTDVHEYFY